MTSRTLVCAGSIAWRRYVIIAVLLARGLGADPAVALPNSATPLTLPRALSLALAADFAIPATRARIDGAVAGVRQAGRALNPSIGVEAENFGGSGSYRGANRPEITLFAQQVIELGGKREARMGVARSEVGATKARGAIRVLDLLRDVELAWVEVQTAEALVQIAQNRLDVSQRLRDELDRRAQAARDPQYTLSRAEAQLSIDRISLDQARANAVAARANLAAYWRGSSDFVVDAAVFDVAGVDRASGYSVDVALLEAQKEVATSRITLEKARAIPDPAVRVGVRHFSETRDTALVAGIAIPIPIFDTNEDNIRRAEAERRAAELDVKAARRTLFREVTRLQSRLIASAAEARRIEKEVLPRATQAIQLVRDGLERGAFGYIEFADAQRTLNDARLRRVEAIRTFFTDNASLGRLTGRHTRLAQKR